MKKIFLVSLTLPSMLVSCGQTDMTNFSLNCQGNTTNYSSEHSVTSRESRKYKFDEKVFLERNCVLDQKTIICTREYISGPQLVSRERFLYNTSDYTLSELHQTIGFDALKKLPYYVKTEIFQSNCPMTVTRVKKAS